MTQAVDSRREFLIALGAEMRQARKRRGWSQRGLTSRLPWNASSQTLATYERGTRRISVVRLVEVAVALDEPPADLLTRALRRTTNDLDTGLCLKLNALAENRRDAITPLRRWARCRLQQAPEGQRTVVLISWPALPFLAKLCDVDADDLVRRLTDPSAGLVNGDGGQ